MASIGVIIPGIVLKSTSRGRAWIEEFQGTTGISMIATYTRCSEEIEIEPPALYSRSGGAVSLIRNTSGSSSSSGKPRGALYPHPVGASR